MIKIFIDGPTLEQVQQLQADPSVSGFTTNPTLMRKLGVTDYEKYGREILTAAKGLHVSLEVFAEDSDEIVRQARLITSWAPNAWVKVPVTNSRGAQMDETIAACMLHGVRVNITAVLSFGQIMRLSQQFRDMPDRCIVSVFAGRIADTSQDPRCTVGFATRLLGSTPVLWASTREICNVVDAERCRCQIITMSYDMYCKMQKMRDTDLDALSLETVQMFNHDARAAGYKL